MIVRFLFKKFHDQTLYFLLKKSGDSEQKSKLNKLNKVQENKIGK